MSNINETKNINSSVQKRDVTIAFSPVLWKRYWLFLTWSAIAWGLMVGAVSRTRRLTVGWSCRDSPTGMREIGGTYKG